MSYFCVTYVTLSSAQNVFTAEFGMDSGGSRSLWSPGNTVKQVIDIGGYNFYFIFLSFLFYSLFGYAAILFSTSNNPLGL
jgi:hypothetical protein